MGIQSLSWGLPCGGRSDVEQTKCSLVTRVMAVGIGVILLVLGSVAVRGVGLHALGTGGGAALIAVGSLSLLAALSVRCIKGGDRFWIDTQERDVFTDPRAVSTRTSTEGFTQIDGQTTTRRTSYCSLESFLASTEPDDIALRERLAIGDFTRRLQENFPGKQVTLALPLKFENGVRNDALLFEILKLIYMTESELLKLPLDEIKTYDEDQNDILALRLMGRVQLTEPYSSGTLGSFIFGEEILSDEVPLSLYFLLTKEKVIFFLQNAKNIDKKTVDALLPSAFRNSAQRTFLTTRSVILLKELPIASIHQVLPFLSGQLLWPLIRTRGKELDYSLLTEGQLDDMLPSSFMEENNTKKMMERIPIEILNGLLPKMGSQLRLLPDNHLEDGELNLKQLPPAKIKSMFPTGFMAIDETKTRINKLSAANRDYVKTIVTVVD